MMRFPPMPRPASAAETPVRARRVSGYFSSTAIATLVMIGATSIAGAQQWTGAVDSDYGTAGNWDPAAVPVAGDDVLIDENVDVDVDAAFDAGTLQQDTATMTVGSGGDLAIAGDALFRFDSALQVNAGGTFSAGSLTVRNAATVDVDGTLAAPTEVLGSGSLNVNDGGTLDGDLLMAGVTPTVTIAQDGTLTGTATVNRGTLDSNGEIQGGIDTTGGNSTVTVTIGPDGSVGGAVTHGAGTLDSSGELNGGLSVGNGVTANINAGGVSGGTTVGLGTLNVNGGTLDGVTLNGGQNGGEVNNSSAINGPVTATGGTFNTDGTITGPVTASGGVFNNSGTITGPVTASGAEVNTTGDINDNVALSSGAFNAEGSISGDIGVTGGTFTTTGALDHDGNFTNAGLVDVAGGDLDTSGDFTNDGDLTLSGADLNVGGLLFTNNDTIILDDGRTLTAPSVANDSGFIGLGAGTPGMITATVGGPVAGSGSSRLDLQNAGAGDSMVIQGGLSGVNTLALDIDVTTSNAGFADILTVNGAVDGNLAITLNPTGGGALTLQSTPITLVDGDTLGGGLDASFTGPLAVNNGLILYRLTEDAGNGDITLQSDINPAIGGVAGAFSSVQSLVSTVVNRPSGAYVSGIAFDAPNNCSTGTWARATGGRTEADTTSTNSLGDRVESRGSMNYGGFQGGADFGCFEAFDGGWDISGGVLAGYNQGEFDERANGLLTTGDFDQYFVGGYVAAAKGNWSGELQLRYANADFTFDNAALDLRDASDDVDSYALSGSMTYRFDLREGLALLPTVGFSVTDNDAASLTFRDEAGNDVGRLKVDSHTSTTTFLGATLSQTRIDEAAATATNAFITGTYYFDGSGSRDSTFTSADGNASTEVTTSEIGDFGEISIGGSYVQVLGTAPGQARQVNYGVRVDARFGDDVEGVGITGQIRLQF